MLPSSRVTALCVVAVLRASWAYAAQEPTLETVLARAAAYVAELQVKLSGIVAEESYVQQMQDRTTGRSAPLFFRRTLKSDFLLVRPAKVERYVEFRDVFEVDGHPVRDREERLTKLFIDPDRNDDQMRAIIDESARHNLGTVPRNVNTPMLSLIFLQQANQDRSRFKRQNTGPPTLGTLSLSAEAGNSTVFRAGTELWVIEFRERRRNTIISTNNGRDFPAEGRFWIDPASGAVMMSELVMDGGHIDAVINVSYQSEPLLGFQVPVEMRERYRVRRETIEGVATYGRFRRFNVHTDEVIGPPAAPGTSPAKRPPPGPPRDVPLVW
jgi:hypothetical protein